MSAIQMQAYKNLQKATIVSDREIDAYALTQSALKLRECQENWEVPDEREKIDRLFGALRMNSMLWSIFQAELTREGNPLPEKVREDLFSLSLFVDRRTKDIMCFPEPEKLTILININLNLAAGLRASPSEEEKATPAEPCRASQGIAVTG
jgi:flagellar biosynthesis activator protein FlaF